MVSRETTVSVSREACANSIKAWMPDVVLDLTVHMQKNGIRPLNLPNPIAFSVCF